MLVDKHSFFLLALKLRAESSSMQLQFAESLREKRYQISTSLLLGYQSNDMCVLPHMLV